MGQNSVCCQNSLNGRGFDLAMCFPSLLPVLVGHLLVVVFVEDGK